MPAGRTALCVGLGLASLCCTAEAKLKTGTLRIGGPQEDDRWRFLAKFGYGIGTGTYDIRLRLRGTSDDWAVANFNLEAFLDEDWEHTETLPACQRAAQGPSRAIQSLEPGPPGKWGPWLNGDIEQVVRSHIWYFAITRCEGELTGKALDVDYELRLRQDDGSELSFELRCMPFAGTLALVGLTALSARLAQRCRRFARSAGTVHPVIRVLAGAVTLQWAAQALGTLHLWAYARDGVGLAGADMLAELCFMLSQVVSSTLLIAISQGYTLSRSSTRDLALVRPVTAMMAALHMLLVGLGKMEDDASHKHHEHEGAVGWAILVVRVLLFGWFTAGVHALRRQGGLKMQHFTAQFQLVGSAYFLAYPTIYVVVQAFAPYLQHPVLQIGLLAMQTASAAWLTDLFLSRGAYFEVSQLSSSLLPGGAGCPFPSGLKED